MELQEDLDSLNQLCKNICKCGKGVLESVQTGDIDVQEVIDSSNEQLFELKQLIAIVLETAQIIVKKATEEKLKDCEDLLLDIKTSANLVTNDFIDSLTNCCTNPYDYSLQQNLQILYAKILSNFNEVIGKIEMIKNGQSTQAEEILQTYAKNAVCNIRTLSDLLSNEEKSIDEFSRVARVCFESLISLKSVVLSNQTIPKELVDKFGRLIPMLIKCAKESFLNGNDLESKKNFDLMKQGIAKFIHQFLTIAVPVPSPNSTPSTSPSSSPRSDRSDRSDKSSDRSSDRSDKSDKTPLIDGKPASSSNVMVGNRIATISTEEKKLENKSLSVPAVNFSAKKSSSSKEKPLSGSRTSRREERKEKKKKKKEAISDSIVGDLLHEKPKKGSIIHQSLDRRNSEAMPVGKTPSSPQTTTTSPFEVKKKFSAIANNSDNAAFRSASSFVQHSNNTNNSGGGGGGGGDDDRITSHTTIVGNEFTRRQRPHSRHDIAPQKHSSQFSERKKKEIEEVDGGANNSVHNVLQFFITKFPSIQDSLSSFLPDQSLQLKKQLANILLINQLEDNISHFFPILTKSNELSQLEPVRKFGMLIARILGMAYAIIKEADVSLNTQEMERDFHGTFMSLIDTIVDFVKSSFALLQVIPSIADINSDILDAIAKIKATCIEYLDSSIINSDPAILACKKHNVGQINSLIKQTLWYRTHGVRLLSSQLLSTLITLFTAPTACQNMVLDVHSISMCLSTQLSLFYHILRVSTETSKLKTSNNFQNTSTQESVDELLDINIWDYEANNTRKTATPNKKDETTVATLNSLIEMLTSDTQYDANFMKTFICTYQSFTTPSQLLAKLKQRFFYPNSINAQRGSAIQMRVCVVLKYWVQQQFNDFDDNLVNSLFDFLENSVKKCGHPQLADIIIVQLLEKTRERQFELENKVNTPPLPLENIHIKSESILDILLKYSPVEVARQMTIIDMNYFRAIQPTELIKQAWNSSSLKWKALNINQLMDRLNSISYWLATIILSYENVSSRVKVFEWLYEIAIHLRKLNNYHSVMGFVVGFNISGISRLKHTRESMDPKITKQFSTIEDLMDPSSSFKNYRKQFNVMKLPAIPYLGVHLTDLVFIEDGNPDEIDGKINFPKRELVYKTISEIQVFQQSNYEIPIVEPIHTLLLYLPSMSEKHLYKLSLLREPRG